MTTLQSTVVCDPLPGDDLPESAKTTSAAAGIQLFQVFSSTSSLLGLSRSADYAMVNANLNSICHWRKGNALNAQSNMWGAVAGTGLAGGGTGAAGKHGPSGETVSVGASKPAEPEPEALSKEDYPPEVHKRDLASSDLVVAHRESGTPLELQQKASFANLQADGFAPVRGLQVSLRTKEADDKVLVICNLPTTMEENHDGVNWTLKRGEYLIGPQHLTWTHDLGRLENVLMPWLDEPGKARMSLDYTVSGRLKGSVHLSKEGSRRQLTAISVPGGQVTVARSHEPAAVEPGRWHDVPGLKQISVTNPGEKVLIVCSIKYTALWSDELTRGRFTIFRDGVSLDPESFGLQSVRATQRGLKRSLVMALVDEPEAGPHLYQARAAVTTEGDEARVCHLDEDDRQLALIRLPGGSVVGPARCDGSTLVEEDRWTEILGLSVTVSVQRPSDKVLLVYSANFNPSGFEYEAYFTIHRTGQSGGTENLGREDQGMWSVASSAAGSSEYPVGMFTDAPGVGTHTYRVSARTRRCGGLTQAPEIEVGPDGQLSAVSLTAGRPAGNVVEQMQAEMDEAMASYNAVGLTTEEDF